MTGYVHGKSTVVISAAELQRLRANQRAKPIRPKSAPQIEATILQAPGAQRRHWDKARMQDAQIKRCRTCGDWAWRGKCTVPHELLAEGEAA